MLPTRHITLPRLTQLRDRENGFTLIELMITVLIIAILAVIAIPIYQNLHKEAHKATIQSDVHNTVTHISGWLSSHPTGNIEMGGAIDTTQFDIVQTDGNTVVVVGTWDEYTVTGTNPEISDNYQYIYRSNPDDGGNAYISVN